MFDLEQSVTEWRQRMLAAGIETPVPLEELEDHLRDEIERQMKLGASPRQAFGHSIEEIGQAGELKGEFKKICGTKYFPKLSQWSLFWTGVSLLAITVIVNLVLPFFLSLVKPFVFHSSALISISHPSRAVWLPDCVMFTTFTICGLIVGLARWHDAKWTWLWISSLGLTGTMMANLVCQFGFYRSDSGLFSSESLLRCCWFYVTWMIFVVISLNRGRFPGLVARILRRKATRD